MTASAVLALADVTEILKTSIPSQSHLLDFYSTLSESEQIAFLKQLSLIDYPRVSAIFKKATTTPPIPAGAKLEPLPDHCFDTTINNTDKVNQWRKIGLESIAANKVAVILMAGGQGTRLGSSDPKGCFDIGLPSHKSLFQIQAERIIKLQLLAQPLAKPGVQVVIPWYIMTSGPTHEPTETFFKNHQYFGLNPANIFFFEQGVLPAFTPDGKIFLESKSSLAVAPDGNGGIYAALRLKGVIADMEKRGIESIHAYCVDNCLVKVADPVFIGYCLSKKAECGAKVVPKRSATEAVGVLCLRNSKFNVVEYSEIDPAMAALTKSNGTLVFNAANIANHYYTLDFLKRVPEFESQLEYHVAHKKIKHVDPLGKRIKYSPIYIFYLFI